MQCFIALATEASDHPTFMGIFPTISHTYQSYLADHLIDEFLLVTGVAGGNKKAG